MYRPLGATCHYDGYLTPCCTTFDPDLWNKPLVSQTWVEAYSSSALKMDQSYRREKGNLICQGCAIHPQNQDSQNLGSRPHQAPARYLTMSIQEYWENQFPTQRMSEALTSKCLQ